MILEAAEQCRVALETGILPRRGALEDQDDLFCEVFPVFVERWRARSYDAVWRDVRDYVKIVLEAVLGKKR